MKIAVAGGGAFGKEHLRTLDAMGGVTLSVAEPRAIELDRLGGMIGLADRDTNAITLIDRFRPDGLIVASPAHTHEPIAAAALERGIPVLVEKPVAPDSASMRRLCEAAEASTAFLQPGHILRFSSDHRRLLDILGQGEIGDFLSFTSRRYRDAGHAERYAGIDPVLMTMIHDIDLALWFGCGPAQSASAVRRPVAGTARSLTTACLHGAGCQRWQLSAAWLHPGPDCPPDRVEIIGTQGSAELVAGSHIEVYGASHRRIAADAGGDPLRTELDCFLSGIRAGASQAPVCPRDALDGILAAEMVMKALDA